MHIAAEGNYIAFRDALVTRPCGSICFSMAECYGGNAFVTDDFMLYNRDIVPLMNIPFVYTTNYCRICLDPGKV